MTRTTRGTLISGLLGTLLLVGGNSFAEGDAKDAKCTLATKGDSQVAKACAEGGLAAAKKAMKVMVKAAKANGVKFECDDCHKDTDGKYELTADGKDKFKKLLAALAVAPAAPATPTAPATPKK